MSDPDTLRWILYVVVVLFYAVCADIWFSMKKVKR